MKKVMCCLVLCVLTMSMVFAQGKTEEASSGVKQKKHVSIYTCNVEEEAIAYFKEFTKETGIAVDYVRLSAGECITRMEAEKANPQVSVMLGGSVDTIVSAYEKGLIEKYNSPNMSVVVDQYKDNMDGVYTPYSLVVTCFASNKKLLDKLGIPAPASWADLLQPALKGNVCMAHPATSGAAYTAFSSILQCFGEEKGFEYLKNLDKSIIQYTKAGAAPIRMAGLGETTVAVCYDLDAHTVINDGYELVITYPSEGTGYEISCVELVKNGPADEQDAAKTFIDWMLSEKAQKMCTDDYYRYPINKNVPVNPQMIPFKDITLLDYDFLWSGKNKVRLLEVFENEVRTSANVLK
ncbi:MAG: ABC transporter substrate-binding protein [Sphaerochaetaceae bacterium]|jgi:iron(III) transport system substrate-binding protein